MKNKLIMNNIDKESIEKVINKHFNPLEDKVNNISQSTQLTGKDIFDITTTGMSYYDAMIQKGHITGNRDPVEYFKTNKGITFKIEWMSPEEYLKKEFNMRLKTWDLDDSTNDLSFEDYISNSLDFELIEQYKKRTLEGSKMPMPMLDYNDMSQEGRHRAVVAQQLNIEEIPVLIVKPYEE